MALGATAARSGWRLDGLKRLRLEAQAAEARGTGARAADVGQLDLLRVSDDDPFHLAPPVE